MKERIKSFFARKVVREDNEELSVEKIEQLSDEILNQYRKTFSDLARYDRNELDVHEVSH